MANPARDFSGLQAIEITDMSPENIKAATAFLTGLHGRGQLEPIDGWEGDTLEGYLDLLGLNGRSVRLSRPAGIRV